MIWLAWSVYSQLLGLLLPSVAWALAGGQVGHQGGLGWPENICWRNPFFYKNIFSDWHSFLDHQKFQRKNYSENTFLSCKGTLRETWSTHEVRKKYAVVVYSSAFLCRTRHKAYIMEVNDAIFLCNHFGVNGPSRPTCYWGHYVLETQNLWQCSFLLQTLPFIEAQWRIIVCFPIPERSLVNIRK